MTMRKVIALCSIQRHPMDGQRVLIKAGTPFEIEKGSEEEAQLESLNAIRDAKDSDIKRAEEDGLAPIKRSPRFRTRREIRAIEDAERDLANRGVRRPQAARTDAEDSGNASGDDGGESSGGEQRDADPGTGRGSPRSAVKSTTAAELAADKKRRSSLV